MLDTNRHGLILKQILRQIFQDNRLIGHLAFKGGTCLYLFYDLPRFSVDLDFDLLPATDEFPFEVMSGLLSQYGQIVDSHKKEFTYFWSLSYESGWQRIKVEINRRSYEPNRYIPLDFYGISIPTMTSECMMAHKLCAISNRTTIQNRDLFDSWFMLAKKNWSPDPEIIKLRTGLTVDQYYKELVRFIAEDVSQTKVLDGLGQLLMDNHQRDWIKSNLLTELSAMLKMRIS
jgi:predicted nucleotidyltransferase component of viral defense system